MEVSDEDGGGSDEKKTTPPYPTPAMVQPSNLQPAKRKMKTPFQLEHLEKAFVEASFPSEETRAELSMKLALTDRQLQMWFCHRRLKEKKTNNMNAMIVPNSLPKRKASENRYSHPPPRMMDVKSPSPSKSPSLSQSPSSSPSHSPLLSHSSSSTPSPLASPTSNNHKSAVSLESQTMLEHAKIDSVMFMLGNEFREDGPFLSTAFDSLPQRAFGKFLERTEQQNLPEQQFHDENFLAINATKSYKAPSFVNSTENDYIPSSSSGKRKRKRKRRDHVLNVSCSQLRHGNHFPSEQLSIEADGNERLVPPHFYDKHTGGLSVHDDDQKNPCYNLNSQLAIKQDSEHGVELEHKRVMWEEETRLEKKRKIEDRRISKEISVHKKRLKKELEKQETLKRKRDEQMRKEMERQDREKKKEEDKLLREKQREEERHQRELKRVHERREKVLQKENLRAEKIRIKEEIKKEKEAARIKAANERAAARKYMDLIEDERLELMNIAASSKGLTSITCLDDVTLQNLNTFQEMLKEFPPQSVYLKQPFSVRPWIDSNECIGNLLMVWNFLINFADVLSLWPFTLDEFVQALHDYDSRLLSEIHISLLKFIIKDIEDVVSSISPGGNHNSAANPGIGHSQVVVKEAYAWGFDIKIWENHLNHLTWPEILRQFALCAGFGPQLRKYDETASHRNEDECHDSEDVISALRSGMAAENALSTMQGKGSSHLRRKRHILTPGTVKFAAFHVLSLEGSNGLTILEIADKIQKSGLRDLTTSKTPEASISAALSRDTELFARTAPSTYCVQAAYRKDPSDADSILATAREKMHMFESRYLEMEISEKDIEGIGGAERDDPEIEGINPKIKFPDVQNQCELNSVIKSNHTGNENDVSFDGVAIDSDSSAKIIDKASNLDASNDHFHESTFEKGAKVDGTEIDESNPGESWIQGLMDGEYSDISVEERLNALVSLVGVVLEGNTIHVILEERMKAVKILKQQMLAEFQLDKKRMKENLCRLELSSLGKNSEMLQDNIANMKSNDLKNPHNLKSIDTKRTMIGQGLKTNPDVSQLQHCRYFEKSLSQIKSYISRKAEQVHPYRSLPLGQDRRHNQYWQFIASASKSDPGSGRIFFESRDGYWQLIDSEEAFDSLLAALDLRGIRESNLHSELLNIESSFKETVKMNKSFNPNCGLGLGSPDSAVSGLTVDPSDRSSSFYIELGQNQMEQTCLMKRYQDFQRWMWKNCFNSAVLCAIKIGRRRCPEMLEICNFCFNTYFSEDKHCSSCHTTFKNRYNFEVIFSGHVACCEQRVDSGCTLDCSKSSLPIRFQMLKMQLSRIEASIPTEALLPFWTDFYRKSWSVKLQLSSSVEDLFQILTILESAIKRDCLSPNFDTTNELLGNSLPVNSMDKVEFDSLVVKVLPWIPHTTAAVVLRLRELDGSIFYDLDLKHNSLKEGYSDKLIELPSSNSVANGIVDSEHMETVGHDDDHFSECDRTDPQAKHTATRVLSSRGRGVCKHGHDGKSILKEEKTKELNGMESVDNDEVYGDEYDDEYYGRKHVVADSESQEDSVGEDEADVDYRNEVMMNDDDFDNESYSSSDDSD